MGAGGEGSAARRSTARSRSLNLIHTNNCSNPASMRVTARFDFPDGVSLAEAQKVINFAFGPLGALMLRRADGG